MSIDISTVTGVHTKVNQLLLENETVLRVEKNDKLMEFDENTYAKLTTKIFHNGQIELNMKSRLLPDAPDFARGFIGIAFRISENDSAFESFYVRPTNGRVSDPIRKQRGVQYFSYPKYTFDYFRKRNITDFEGPADIGLDEWIQLKAIIQNEQATFYINNTSVLSVKHLKLGENASGSIGLFVDTGTEAFFKDIKITHFD